MKECEAVTFNYHIAVTKHPASFYIQGMIATAAVYLHKIGLELKVTIVKKTTKTISVKLLH